MVQLSQDTGHLRAFWLIFLKKKKKEKPHPVVDLTTSQELADWGGCGWRADACALFFLRHCAFWSAKHS